MRSFFLVAKPISQNNRGGKIPTYRRGLRMKLNSAYNTINHIFPGNDPLYGIIYYFRKSERGMDADNVSKPLWDALEDVCYIDDKRIRLRLAGVITQDFNNNYPIPTTNLNQQEINKIISFFNDPMQKHMIFVTIDNVLPTNFRYRL